MDSPPPPPGPPPRPPARAPGSAQALELKLQYGANPLGTRVQAADGELLPETGLGVTARRVPGAWVVSGPEGDVRVRPGDRIALSRGALQVEVAPVRQSRFARFHFEQADLLLPMLILIVTVLFLQLALLAKFFGGEEGGAQGFEPSPEYIARLLDEQFDGKDRGVIAPSAPRPKTGEKIENFYLQPGHDGPRTHLGGGKNVGKTIRDGKRDGEEKKSAAAPAAPAAGPGEQETPPPEVAAEADPVEPADDVADEAADDEPIAVHVDEGWGLSDWYDTQDAREDAQEIQKALELAHQILKLDPNDPYGLTTRAYYEYLAMDYDAALRTYDKFTKLYPDEPAGWNNLALVYKRKGEYEKEEALYRIALGLAPDDDHALNNLAVCLAHQGRYDEALAIMKKLEVLTPDDPYADLHRAKIYAAMGKEDRSYQFLQRSLAGMRKLDTLHNIEFRQDIRVDPVFEQMRHQERFSRLLDRFYGDHEKGWWKQLRKGL